MVAVAVLDGGFEFDVNVQCINVFFLGPPEFLICWEIGKPVFFPEFLPCIWGIGLDFLQQRDQLLQEAW